MKKAKKPISNCEQCNNFVYDEEINERESINKFIKYNIKHGSKILFGILICDLVIKYMFGIQILSTYLSLIETYIYLPIVGLGGLF